MNQKTQVLRLYRNLLKQANKWAYEDSREGRQYKPLITFAIKEDFRLNASVKDPKKIQKLIQEGKHELKAIQEIVDSTFFHQTNHVQDKMPQLWKESVLPTAYHLLSTKSVLKERKNSGLFHKFYLWMTTGKIRE